MMNVVAVIPLLLAYLATVVDPQTAPFLQLFGIGYGFSLLVNFFFIVFWLIFKKRFALISAVAILIGINHMSRYIQILPPMTDTEPDEYVQVISQNVKLFGWYNWRHNIRDRDEMIGNLKEMKGDIYCFQEYFHHGTEGVFNTKDLLRDSLGTPSVHIEYTTDIQGDQHFGIATFTKYPIVSKGRIHFGGERGNLCIYTDMKIGDDTVRVYNAHVASIRFSDADYRLMEDLQKQKGRGEFRMDGGRNIVKRMVRAYKKRAGQTREIQRHIASSPYPVILCGDLNDSPVSYSYTKVSQGLIDAFRVDGWGIGSTYVGIFPSFRIDYIFYDPAFGSFDYTTYPEKVSDHRAIGCKVYFRN